MEKYFEKLYKGSRGELFALMRDALESGKKEFVVTANPETFMIGTQNPEFDALLKRDTTRIIPDGIGVVKGAAMLGLDVSERIPGIELVSYLFEEGSKTGKSVYLYGAKPEVLEKMREMLSDKYPGLVIAGMHDGYSGDPDAIFSDILAKEPDIVLVALGIPKQELLIGRHLEQAGKGIFVGVGGSFDVLSGMKQRAPKFFIDHNLEWFYRIIKEPKRFKRFYSSNVKYIAEIKRLQRGRGGAGHGE